MQFEWAWQHPEKSTQFRQHSGLPDFDLLIFSSSFPRISTSDTSADAKTVAFAVSIIGAFGNATPASMATTAITAACHGFGIGVGPWVACKVTQTHFMDIWCY
jgi:hypothetical protein